MNVYANVSNVEKEDVNFIFNKTVLDLSIKNVGSMGLKALVYLISELLVMLMLNLFGRKSITAKKESFDLSWKIVLNIVFPGNALEDSHFFFLLFLLSLMSA